MDRSVHLILCDFIISFLWVCSGAAIKLFVVQFLGLGFEPKGEILRWVLAISAMFLFAWFGKLTGGGSYNPLTVLLPAITGSYHALLLTIVARIPVQAFGSLLGVKFVVHILPHVGYGYRLNVDMHKGMLTEGVLSFIIVMVSLWLSKKDAHNFFMKTWISSIFKLSLQILGSDLTGGSMNPASAFAWAHARGDHYTKEHLYVYWLAPIEATLLGVWIFRWLAQPQKEQVDKTTKIKKSE
ncbi:hypothetical protein AMTRI_Chr01g104020 [Amborella trichopoda]